MAKAVLKLYNKPVPFVVEKVRDVVTKISNATVLYPSPSPSMPVTAARVNALDKAYRDALDGNKPKKRLMRIEKKRMLNLMSLLMTYVQHASGGDPVKIQAAGFDVKSGLTKTAILPAPQNVRAGIGRRPGEALVQWNGVKKRRNYHVQYCADLSVENPVWINPPGAITGKLKLTIGGLVTGRYYWFRVFTVSTAGISGPSDPARGLVA